MADKPYTVILGGTDEDTTLSSHHVEAPDADSAVKEAMDEAEVTYVDDVIVLEGHHDDIRKERGPVRL